MTFIKEIKKSTIKFIWKHPFLWMELENIILSEVSPGPKDQTSYVLPHMRTLDQGQTQQGD
jgi:hypothetical protein